MQARSYEQHGRRNKTAQNIKINMVLKYPEYDAAFP
jgi:hypothetical protein